MKHLKKTILRLYDGLWFPDYTKERFWRSLFLGFLFYSAVSFFLGIFWQFIFACFAAAILGFILRTILMSRNEFFFTRDVFVYHTAWNEYLAREFAWHKGMILYIPFLFFTVLLDLSDVVAGVARYFFKKNRS
ncbi:MAG: hypothetical protein WC878_00220 [Candidatus Paceibacterota bacterium]